MGLLHRHLDAKRLGHAPKQAGAQEGTKQGGAGWAAGSLDSSRTSGHGIGPGKAPAWQFTRLAVPGEDEGDINTAHAETGMPLLHRGERHGLEMGLPG